MVAQVIDFPGAAAAREPQGLHLTEAEVIETAGGYVRPADQLRELHARGFTRAAFSRIGRRRVLLERAHYDAVVRGQYAAPQQPTEPQRQAPRPNEAALKAFFAGKRRK